MPRNASPQAYVSSGGCGLSKDEFHLSRPGVMKTSLDYQSGKVLHRGEWRYRSTQSVVVLAVLLILIGITSWKLLTEPTQRLVYLLGLAFLFSCSCIVGFLVIFNHKNTFEIRTDGINQSGRFWPWSRIKRFSAIGDQSKPIRKLVYERRGAIFGSRLLVLSEPLPPADFERLIQQVGEATRTVYPRVSLGEYLADN